MAITDQTIMIMKVTPPIAANPHTHHMVKAIETY